MLAATAIAHRSRFRYACLDALISLAVTVLVNLSFTCE